MKIFRTVSFLFVSIGVVWATSIPFSFDCSKDSAFMMDPNQHKQMGYIADFDGGGAQLKRDLQVSLPLKPAYRGFNSIQMVNGQMATNVVGVVEKFGWAGGVGDPITIAFYVSKENAMLLKAATSSGLKTTNIDSIAWWICDYDQETKAWFEKAYPSYPSVPKGVIQGSAAQPVLNIDMTPVPAANGIDVMVYRVTLAVLPRPHDAFTLLFANSSAKSLTKPWGMP